MWKIYAPVKDSNGVWASVRFVNGVGETKNPALVEWFKKHGYRVEKCDISHENPIENCDISSLVVEDESDQIEAEIEPEIPEMMGYNEKQPDLESMTPNELREYAKANGLGGVIKNTRNKEKLIELIRG